MSATEAIQHPVGSHCLRASCPPPPFRKNPVPISSLLTPWLSSCVALFTCPLSMVRHPAFDFDTQWLRVAVSRPPSPVGGPARPAVAAGTRNPSGAAMLGPQDAAVPNENDLGATLSRTETITDDAPLIEKRTTFTSIGDQRAIV